MKKTFLNTCIITLMALGLAGCSDDKDTSSDNSNINPPEITNKANGERCKSAGECASAYCSPLKICAEPPVLYQKSNGEHCFSGTECQSQYCNIQHECDNMPVQLKENGAHCDNANECASGYCNDAHECAKKPAQPKENGAHCEDANECVSGYCNDDHECAEKPAQPKENGAHCEDANECVSGYCNDDHECAEKPAQPKENGAHCEDASECASGYCNSDSQCATKPSASDVLDLQEIPADQNNAEGASCDANAFVEHCNGDKMVMCKYDDVKKQGTVVADACESGYSCALTMRNGKNYPGCISSEVTCEKDDADEQQCDIDDLGYEILRAFSCQLFEDGNYYKVYNEKYCAGACSTKKCEQETCDPLVSKCSDDLNYTLECNEISPGNYIYKAYNCSFDYASCTTYLEPKTGKTWAYCGGDGL
jgi:hypothetical protein